MMLRQFFRRENANQFYFKNTLKFHINWCPSANATQLGMKREEREIYANSHFNTKDVRYVLFESNAI